MGYKYKKQQNKRCYYEEPRIAKQRAEFLIRMRRNREENKKVIYLDETWMHTHDSIAQCWVEKDEVTGGTLGGVSHPSGKGKRLIILHAGSEDGWIPNCELVYQSLEEEGDYHEEMNHQIFEKWFENKLIPNIPPDSLIVMDNASYHSRRFEPLPTSNWRKGDMITWLTNKGIPLPTKCIKQNLYAIIQKHKEKYRKYVTDEMAKAAGHEVVRLPSYHCELNPIEMAWSQVKHYRKTHNREFTLDALERLVNEGFAQVTPERWTSLIKHTHKKMEDVYFTADRLDNWKQVQEFVIYVEADDDESDDSDEDDSDISDYESEDEDDI